MRIATVTLNPAIDETVFLDRLVPGEVNKASRVHRRAGGKGVNVASMLAQAGHNVIVTGLLGAEGSEEFSELFARRGIHDKFIRVPGRTRTNTKIVAGGETTDVNSTGIHVTDEKLVELETAVGEIGRQVEWVLISGSLCPGLSVDCFSRLIDVARTGGARIGVDTSGEALRVAVTAGVDLIKPNLAELVELVGVATDPDECALSLHGKGIAHVMVSLGADGAVFCAERDCVLLDAPRAKVLSSAGAGDALLAGYLSAVAEGNTLLERAKTATVFAWSALESLDLELCDADTRRERMSLIHTRL